MCIKKIWTRVGTDAEQIKIVFAIIAAGYILFDSIEFDRCGH